MKKEVATYICKPIYMKDLFLWYYSLIVRLFFLETIIKPDPKGYSEQDLDYESKRSI